MTAKKQKTFIINPALAENGRGFDNLISEYISNTKAENIAKKRKSDIKKSLRNTYGMTVAGRYQEKAGMYWVTKGVNKTVENYDLAAMVKILEENDLPVPMIKSIKQGGFRAYKAKTA